MISNFKFGEANMKKYFDYLIITGIALILIAISYTGVQRQNRLLVNEEIKVYSLELEQSLDLNKNILETRFFELNKMQSKFYILYDKNNKIVKTNATIDGKIPEFPNGALDEARKLGENRVTWQPKAGVREAAVIRNIGNDQVLVTGKSLKETEDRIDKVGRLYLAGMVLIFGILSVSLLVKKGLRIQ